MNSDSGFLNNPEAVFYGFLLQIRQGPLKSQDGLALALPAQPQDHDAGEKVGRIRTYICKIDVYRDENPIFLLADRHNP